ncbi:hypothetical protein NFI96_005175 [Prochilodus magdalenae]|nr:hypothetical protein NFI96_005175 [Prochilodus magdalenae]
MIMRGRLEREKEGSERGVFSRQSVSVDIRYDQSEPLDGNMSHDVARAGLLDFSPPLNTPSRRNGDKTNKENYASVPVLSLVQFSRSPFVAFGTIKLGSSRSLPLRIENPSEDAVTTVAVDKISSSKGFSVDQTSFTIQPEDSVIVTITWTPMEEGGVRELLSFVANGIVKHQAILLGKAEATKKKKKSLWDSIKSKRDVSTVSKGLKVASMPIKAANKTFHVSQQTQYRRIRGSNPLSPLNQVRPSRRSSGSKDKNNLSTCPPVPEDLPKSVKADLENMPLQKNSPLVLLVPADKLLDASEKGDVSRLPLPKEVRVLNKTLSPISTPERFSTHLTCYLQSPLPVIGKRVNDENQIPGTPTLSVKDALAVIESDLTHAVSPPNACSSFNFSDSLESEHLNTDCDPEPAIRSVENVPPQIDVAQPRLTFFVKSNKVTNYNSAHDGIMDSTACDQKDVKYKKILFSSATVTKTKAEAPVEHSPGTRKIRTSRRRLLEKSTSLSGPNTESNSILSQEVSALPVINCDTDVEFKFIVTSPQVSPQMTHQTVFQDQSTSVFAAPLQPVCITDANINGVVPVDGPMPEMLPPCISLDSFPVHRRESKQNKKRKSEEFSRDFSDESAKSVQVRKSSSVAQEPKKPCPEKRFSARSGQTQYRPTGGQSLKSFSTSKVKTSKVIAVAQSRLNFIKPTQTAIPRHPLPFAAKNMFYDERWLEKQERGFTWWMNYVLTPDDFKVATEVTKVNALSLTMGDEKFNIPKAPTKEEMSFRTYTARRRLNRLRRAACQLFTSDSMVKAIQRLELEVEAKRLLVRKDRHLWKDIGERQKVLNWLLSYNPLWLRIGLETIFGELIPLESNSDVMGLAMFVLGRLLWNPDIAAEFRHSKVPHLYRDGHEEALSRFTLKKLLLLVCFLDKAKESRLIEHDPCLFCMDAEFKSTKDLLLAFARDFLSGEGILSRHLNLLGLPVSHVQTPLAEFNFAVQNLAVDLRCGIRLVRIMELFTQDWSLSCKLRMPAISRLQKVHNVDIALQALKEKGVSLKDERGTVIDSRDIVDGHREKTLNLLWKIIFTFQVEVLLDEEQLKDEISFLKKTWRTKQKLALLKADKCAMKSSKETLRFEQPSEKLTLLLDWVNAVCEFYNLKAENFTVSFSDGRILCYLIHHYHPNQLLAENIQQKTTQTIECDHRGKVELNNSSSDSDCSFDSLEQKGSASPPVDFRVLLENERSNFQMVNTAVSYLGGVPAMISPEDMSNTIPNEKVVTCYLSFLSARLLDLRNETRAARVIQSAWRRYKLQKDMQLIQERNLAACKIQALVRSFIQKRRLNRQNRAATLIQAFWRGYSAQKELKSMKEAKRFAIQNRAAVLIQQRYRAKVVGDMLRKEYQALKHAAVKVQALWRGRLERKRIRQLHQCATVIQSHYRRYVVQRKLMALKHAALVIQRRYRAFRTGRKIQSEFFAKKKAVTVLQSAYRGMRVRQEMVKKHKAATLIQTAVRSFMCRTKFVSLRSATIVIQQHYRAHILSCSERDYYVQLRQATVRLQAIYRGTKVRSELKKKQQAATAIQACFRMHKARVSYLDVKCATIIIQRRYRAYVCGKNTRASYLTMKAAIVTIQSRFRGTKVRKDLQKMHIAATTIQAYFRGHSQLLNYRRQKWAACVIQRQFRANKMKTVAEKQYAAIRKAALCIQSAYRGMMTRKRIAEMQTAAIVIQRRYKTYKQCSEYQTLKQATILIQQHYRGYVCGKNTRASYLTMKAAIVTIQSGFRGMKVRKDLQKMHIAATTIQAYFRGHAQLLNYRRQKWAACVIQRQFRANKMKTVAEKQYTAMRKAALCIQSAYRGMMTRKRIAEMQMAAIVIQRRYKTYKQYSEYQTLKQAAIIIQRKFRATLLGKQQRERYHSMQKAAISLQAAYRGMSVRRTAQKRHEAATVIQAWCRMYKVRMAFQAMRLAAVLIQRQYRCHLERKEARTSFLKLRHSAIVVQAVFRGNRTRREIARLHSAATVIQRRYMAYKDRKSFLSLKTTVKLCQRKWRAILAARREREAYLAKRNAVIVIQAACRGMKVRRQMQMEREAAITIQSHVRKLIYRRYYQRLLWATRTVQQRFHANKMMKHDMQTLKEKKRAAAVLQAAFRGMKARQALKRMQQAAIVIQSAYRTHCAQTRYLCMKYAAIAIQQRFRSTLAARKQRQDFLKLRFAAISLQAYFRGQRVRKEIIQCHKAAKVIQASFRRHREITKFQAMRLAAIIVQRHYRSYLVAKASREKFLTLKKSAVLIQAAFRGYSLRLSVARKHQAATIVQAAFRMHKQRCVFKRQCWSASILQERFRAWKLGCQQRQAYQQMKVAAINLQKSFRGKQARELVKRIKAARTIQSYLRMSIQRRCYMKTKAAIVMIQSAYRGHYCWVQYTKMRKSAVLIQQWYRSRKLVQKQQNDFKAVQKATLTLQCALRRMFARRLAKRRRAAVKIQSILRMHVHRRRYLSLRSSTMMLQARYRMCTARKTYLRYQTAAVAVQTFYRAYRAKLEQRQHYLKTLESVRTLQAHVRGFIEYRRFQKTKASAVTIQACYRGMIERRKFQHLKKAVHVVQKRYRAHQLCQRERTRFLKLRRSAILIQERNAAVVIQSAFRGYRQRQTFRQKKALVLLLQRRFRALQLVKAEKENRRRRNAAAITIQAFCRGWLTRRWAKEAASAARRHRFIAAAYHHICAVRIQRALRAHWALEAAKRQISSVIHVQYNKTIDAVYEVPDSVDTLLDLIQIYREKAGDKVADKGGSIFTKACFLLVILVQDQKRAMGVKKLPKASERICSIYRLMLRKYKMDVQRTQVKQRMNVSLNGSFLPQATPQKSKPVARFAPDWVLHRGKMKDLVDPLGAIQMLVKALALKP